MNKKKVIERETAPFVNDFQSSAYFNVAYGTIIQLN